MDYESKIVQATQDRNWKLIAAIYGLWFSVDAKAAGEVLPLTLEVIHTQGQANGLARAQDILKPESAPH